jgi:hypothetical protein
VSERGVPQEVLSEEIKEKIAGRRVRAAVFTTFSFDPGFFEMQILPVLFDCPFRQPKKLRLIQLEDAIRSVDALAVYYDHSALSQDAEPAQLGYERIDVRREGKGIFHPKVVLLLVDEPSEQDVEGLAPRYQSLIVGILSANLTRSGWWENVECGHFEEIKDFEVDPRRSPFRKQIISLIDQIKKSAESDEAHAALSRIHEFIINRTQTGEFSNTSAKGAFYSQIYCGQDRFSDWIASLRLPRKEWNLEIISPFFDAKGAAPLRQLQETLDPREIRVYLPRGTDGKGLVSAEVYDAVAKLARWSDLPPEVVRRGRGRLNEKLAPRHVHAKVYRLWSGRDRNLIIVGSVNLTSAAHSHWGGGNLEAAFLNDATDDLYPRQWWLRPIDDKAGPALVEQSAGEDEGLEPTPLDISFRYDWGRRVLEYFLRGPRKSFKVAEPSGRDLFSVVSPDNAKWVRCPDEARDAVGQHLLSSSFLLILHGAGQWRILVREENTAHRPSLMARLTPEEILEYWALLTPEQQAAFMEAHVGQDEFLEGLRVTRVDRLQHMHTLFDRFAGIYHSFGCLRRHVEASVLEGRLVEAETRLLGARYDSLPTLLQRCLEAKDRDPSIQYVTFLCARQVAENISRAHKDFRTATRDRWATLDALLNRLPELRAAIPSFKGGNSFYEWYEPIFLKDLSRK